MELRSGQQREVELDVRVWRYIRLKWMLERSVIVKAAVAEGVKI